MLKDNIVVCCRLVGFKCEGGRCAWHPKTTMNSAVVHYRLVGFASVRKRCPLHVLEEVQETMTNNYIARHHFNYGVLVFFLHAIVVVFFCFLLLYFLIFSFIFFLFVVDGN